MAWNLFLPKQSAMKRRRRGHARVRGELEAFRESPREAESLKEKQQEHLGPARDFSILFVLKKHIQIHHIPSLVKQMCTPNFFCSCFFWISTHQLFFYIQLQMSKMFHQLSVSATWLSGARPWSRSWPSARPSTGTCAAAWRTWRANCRSWRGGRPKPKRVPWRTGPAAL